MTKKKVGNRVGNKVGIVILAAGKATRMGSPKQLLKFGNTTLLGTIIEHAQKSNAQSIVCILGAKAELIKTSINRYQVATITNTEYNTGLSSSIVCGVKYMVDRDMKAVILLLADQPFVTTEYINKLIEQHLTTPEYSIASNYGKKKGVPAIFPHMHFDALLQLKGDIGAKEILNSKENKVKIVPMQPNLLDIDTPETYQLLRKK